MPMLRIVLTFATMALVAATVLFGAAGSLAWPMGWLYVVLVSSVTVGSRLIVARLSPETLEERARFATVGGVQPGDRALVLIVAMIGPMAVLLVAGLDRRFGWSGPVPAWVQAAAVGCALAGAAIATWAMAANPFFSAVARIQTDRGHRVISAGPYRWVRHPGYSSSILATFAIPLLLASLWGLVPATLTAIAIIVRTAREDRMLRQGLRGYQAYAATTRWRLVPGIW